MISNVMTNLLACYRDAKNMAKNVLETFIDVLQNVKGILF